MTRRTQSGFQLPPEITFHKEHGPTGWVYSFRHRDIGQLGHILLQGRPDGQTQVISEIAGDPSDPMSEQRKAIFGPVAMEITRQMDLATGGTGETKPSDPSPYKTPKRQPEGFQSKHMQCDKCDAFVAVLIIADHAEDPSDMEDCARLMFPKVREWNLPTWVIGPAFVDGPEFPAPILKIWPNREPLQELRPDEFNPIIDRLSAAHCG